jgi:undecaprenyl-diphosphatase
VQTIIAFDIKLFYLINNGLANPLFDVFMPFITNLNNWKIPILLIWLWLMIKGGRKGRVAAILLVVTVVITDQLSATLIKPLAGRIRPCYVLDHVRLLVGCGGKYSFPSSHATNISGMAVILSFFYRKGIAWFTLLALVIGFSRIYVGVHYPVDVLGGLIIGSCAGIIVIIVYLQISVKIPPIRYQNIPEPTGNTTTESDKNVRN